ncbi:S1 RNA-binding domain-containing protein, partial [Acinetobacter baumannii]
DKGAVVSGVVKSVEAKGAVVTLSLDVEGYLRASEISSGRVEDATTALKEGQEIETMILSVDRKTRSIQLSIKARDTAETAQSMARLTEASASSGTTN